MKFSTKMILKKKKIAKKPADRVVRAPLPVTHSALVVPNPPPPVSNADDVAVLAPLPVIHSALVVPNPLPPVSNADDVAVLAPLPVIHSALVVPNPLPPVSNADDVAVLAPLPGLTNVLADAPVAIPDPESESEPDYEPGEYADMRHKVSRTTLRRNGYFMGRGY